MTGNSNIWVWFDLDDTIIDFHANAREALKCLFVTQQLNRWFNSIDDWINRYEAHNSKLWERYSQGEISQTFLRENRFALPLIDVGVDNTKAFELSKRFDPLYLDRLAEGRNMVDGAVELLKSLRRCDTIRIGIISNGFIDIQHRKIDHTGIRPLIDLIVLSDDIGITKPDIRIFHHAMKLSGQSDTDFHYMIGDNPTTDIKGASDAGWKCFWLDNGHFKNIQLPADAIRIESMRELLNHNFSLF